MNLPEDVDSPDSDPSAAFGEFYRGEVAGQVRSVTLILGSDDAANDVVHDSMVEASEPYPSDLRSSGTRQHHLPRVR